MRSSDKEFSRRSWRAVAAVIVLLVALSFVPPQQVGGVKLRRANILSELLSFEEGEQGAAERLFDEADFEVDFAEVAERIVADTAPPAVQLSFEWRAEETPADSLAAARTIGAPASPDELFVLPEQDPLADSARYAARHFRTDPSLQSPELIPVEVRPDSTGFSRFAAFCDTLLTVRRPVRIAVLGDSFIEGDILTADLRERLQALFGGGGVGFAPMASPLTAFRRTVKTVSKGWSAYNIMQRKTAPEAVRANFFVSGWGCRPETGATTRWEATSFRRQADSCTTARIFLISPSESRLVLTLNDTLRYEVVVPGDAAVRQIVVGAPSLRSLAFGVESGAEGMIGYGALFEGDAGVVVDNYSVRSNNGQAMFWTNPSVNAQIDAMLSYDLVILQYGLNIMQQGVRDYAAYGRQIAKMVAYVRECFPSAAVLVLGVSERSVKGEGGFEPMDALPYMIDCQRRAALDAGAAFWDTRSAMRSWGGMEAFVRSGWAGKDYTHINYAGGSRVARSLTDALVARAAGRIEAMRLEELRRRRAEAIVDSVRRARIALRLFPAAETPVTEDSL